MKLPVIPFINKKPKIEYFISLLFKHKSISAILLNNKESNLSIISTKNVLLDLESATNEEMISAADEAISSIELSLDEGEKLEKTIFSVPYSWSNEEGSIKKEKLLQLKKLSIELALKPMGFIISIEALIKYFQDKEGVPLSAIFVDEAKDKVYVYLVKGGNIVEVHSEKVTDEVEKAVEYTLKKVEKFETLPSKMILLYHDDIDSRQQAFLNYSWTKDLPFLHFPQISLMEKGFENETVVDAIASQLDSEVDDKVKISGAEIIDNDASNVVDSSENFGFVKEQDIFLIEEDKEEVKEEVYIKDNSVSGKNFHNRDEDKEEKTTSGERVPIIASILGLPKKILGITEGGSLPSRLKMLFIPIVAVVIFIVFMIVYFLVFLRVEVVVFIDGEKVEDEVIVNLSEEDDTSYGDKILRIDAIEQEVTGKVSQDTTGTEEFGESAKGEVTILSSLDKDSIIESGTIIISSNGLEFSLDDDVNIASSSGVSDIKSVKAKVTSEKIGKEHNLPSGTKFSVEGFESSSVEAKNDVAFAGGTKEEKRIVSKDDIESLEEKLLEELFEDALSASRANVGNDEEIISVLLDSSIEKEEYSASIGDEESSIELEATVLYTLGVYKKDEAEKFINESGGEEMLEGLVISEEDSKIRLEEIEQNKGRITGKLIYEVLYRLDIDLSSVSKELAGKSSQSAREYVKNIEGVSDASIIFKNKLPLLPSILPIDSNHIQVNIRSKN